jgi:PAS domain S-box-containing protein
MQNQFVNPLIQNQLLNGVENQYLISKTNPYGKITFCNSLFCDISGYSYDELIGKNHNIVRHPDMPKQIFENLWNTIKIQKTPWTGFVKNKRKDDTHYWVLATIFPMLDEKGDVIEYISLRKEISNIMEGYEEEQNNSHLFEMLYLDYKSSNLDENLKLCLQKILDFKWLEVQKKGGILLWNSTTEELEMFVHQGVGPSLLSLCNRVKKGVCLCGLAATRKTIVFKDCVDHEHNNVPDGILPHGHYNVPLMWNGELQGVLFLYVEHGHKKKDVEIKVLEKLGIVLAGMIYKTQLQKNIKKANEELSNLNSGLQQLIEKNLRITELISRYTPKGAMEHVIEVSNEKSDNFMLKKNFHFLFMDMVDFTSFSENNDPEIVVDCLNMIFDKVTDIIYKHQGDIDKFIGDAVFAFFSDPDSCLKASVNIQEAMKDININPRLLKHRIGIHSGLAIHGNVGGQRRKDYTLIGDAVNTTQRIEKACKPGRILMSADFVHSLQHPSHFSFSRRHKLMAKGKKNEVKVYFLDSQLN